MGMMISRKRREKAEEPKPEQKAAPKRTTRKKPE